MTAAIVHFDICGPDDGDLRTFYSDVFAWTVDVKGPGYALVETPHLRGAVVEAPEPAITIGIAVPDLDAAIESAVAHGAAVVMPPTDNGWVCKAQITDPSGNLLTLIQE